MSNTHSALGQALGYIYQFDRATYCLLNASVSTIEIGIEDVEDISIHFSDGKQVREQDKSVSSKKNPLTDRSVSLWKTLSIWAEDILVNSDILDTTEFHIVTNGRITDNSLAARINSATDLEKANEIVREIKLISKNLRDELINYGNIITQLSEELLARLILKIHVFDNVSPSYGGKLEDIQSLRFFSHEMKIRIFDSALGWIKRRIRKAIDNNERPRILRSDFDKEMRPLIRRFQVAPLLALVKPQIVEAEIDDYKASGFVQQLEWIECDESFISDAVIHYICVRETLLDWADANLVSETSIMNYQNDLITRWRIVRSRIARAKKSTLVEKGQDCLYDTLEQEACIDGQQMPKHFVCGSFHSLADFDKNDLPKIGWHPNFLDLAKQERE